MTRTSPSRQRIDRLRLESRAGTDGLPIGGDDPGLQTGNVLHPGDVEVPSCFIDAEDDRSALRHIREGAQRLRQVRQSPGRPLDFDGRGVTTACPEFIEHGIQSLSCPLHEVTLQLTLRKILNDVLSVDSVTPTTRGCAPCRLSRSPCTPVWEGFRCLGVSSGLPNTETAPNPAGSPPPWVRSRRRRRPCWRSGSSGPGRRP